MQAQLLQPALDATEIVICELRNNWYHWGTENEGTPVSLGAAIQTCDKCDSPISSEAQFCANCGASTNPVIKRVTIPKKVRFEVFKRDDYTCQYCGRGAPEVTLEADHIVPVAEGGTNEMFNLKTACTDCNRGKGATALDNEEYAQNQELIAAQRELSEAIREKQNAMFALFEASEEQALALIELFMPALRESYGFGIVPDHRNSLLQYERRKENGERLFPHEEQQARTHLSEVFSRFDYQSRFERPLETMRSVQTKLTLGRVGLKEAYQLLDEPFKTKFMETVLASFDEVLSLLEERIWNVEAEYREHMHNNPVGRLKRLWRNR